MLIIASEVGSGSQLGQLAPQSTLPGHKWFTTYDNKLDGTYHPIASDGSKLVGWWGITASDIAGIITTSPYVEVQYVTATDVSGVRVSGDPFTGNYPVNFQVDLYSGVSLVHTEVITSNTINDWSLAFSSSYSVTKLRVTITKISVPNQPARLIAATDLPLIKSADDLTVVGVPMHLLRDSRTSRDDLIVTTPLHEAEAMTVNFARPGTLVVGVTETSKVMNIFKSADADSRQILARVTVTYTDLFQDESIIASASDTAPNTSAAQLADGIVTPQYKWLALGNNKLDGTFHPMSTSGQYSTGWWGTQISDIAGALTVPEILTITFTARPLWELKLYGDSLLGQYPVDFVFKAYDANNAILGTWAVTNNTDIYWTQTIDSIPNVTKITATITKINKPYTVAKVTEMYTAVVESYDVETIVSMHLLEEIGYSTGALPIGNISANEIDIVLDNSTNRFDINNQQSPLYGLVKRNRRVEPWLGAYVGDAIEWHRMGIYWTTSWDIPKGSLMATLTARDRLELMRQTQFTTSITYQNKTLYALFDIVLQDAGLKATEYVIDAALVNTVIPYAWFERMSHRDAIQRLASCGIIQVFCTKDGVVHVNEYLDAGMAINVVFDDDINVFQSSYPLAVEAQVNYIEVGYAPLVVDVSETLYDYDDDAVVPAGNFVTHLYAVDNVPIMSCSAPVVTADIGITVDSYAQYAWGLSITFKNTAITSGTVHHVTITGQSLKRRGSRSANAQDPTLVRQDGQMKQTISHDFIQSASYAQILADQVLATFKSARHDVTIDNRGHVALELGDRVTVKDADQQVSADYMISRQTLVWDGSLSATTEGKKL